MKCSQIPIILSLLCITLLLESCRWHQPLVRIRTLGKNRKENLQSIRDTIQNKPPTDTINREVKQLKYEQFVFLANLITSNLVKAQKSIYEKRYTEAEGLILQTISWYPTADAYLLLGSLYKIQGRIDQGDSCWSIAQRLDPEFQNRVSFWNQNP